MAVSIGEERQIKIESVDTLYSRWNKDKTKIPFFRHTVLNTDQEGLEKANELITKYGLGFIFIRSGKLSDISSWVDQNNVDLDTPPIFIAQMNQFFQLPFQSEIAWPLAMELEAVIQDSLVYELGILHGQLLKKTGFDVVHFDSIPKNYSLHELSKVEYYLQGLKKCGLWFSLGPNAAPLGHWVGWENVLVFEDGVKGKSKQKIKVRKDFRKQYFFQGVFSEAYNAKYPLTKQSNQICEGVGVLRSNDFQHLFSEFAGQDIFKKSDVRKAVKNYFMQWRKVKSTPSLSPISLNIDKLKKRIDQETIILIKDDSTSVPIRNLANTDIVSIVDDRQAHKLIDRYAKARHWGVGMLDLPYDEIAIQLGGRAVFIIDLSLVKDKRRLNKIQQLQQHYEIVGLHGGDLVDIEQYDFIRGLIWSPRTDKSELLKMIQVAFGAEDVVGRLPGYMTLNGIRKGISRKNGGRLKYVNIDDENIDYTRLSVIDSLVNKAIKDEEIPGCQVMMIKEGQVVYDKVFGYHTYDSLNKTEWNQLYDIASVTKTTATVPVIMHAIQNGQMTLDGTIGDYLPALAESNKANISLELLLKHESGLLSYHPFWAKAHYDSIGHAFLYKQRKIGWRRAYNYQPVHWQDSINAWVSRVRFNKLMNPDSTFRYLYSDIGFMLLSQMAERVLSRPFEKLAQQVVYEPMGMNFTGFNPKNKFTLESIIPTENDNTFRYGLLRGEVHDKNAALLGGVSGHAGLFANANDLAKYMQMILQNGYYGGEQLFDPDIVKKFTIKPPESYRRALGWDKPSYSVSNASRYASKESFGHSGFTGTLVWADPKHQLIYIFLSNRIHPDPQNYKLIHSNTRSRIHDVMYESIISQESVVHHGL